VEEEHQPQNKVQPIYQDGTSKERVERVEERIGGNIRVFHCYHNSPLFVKQDRMFASWGRIGRFNAEENKEIIIGRHFRKRKDIRGKEGEMEDLFLLTTYMGDHGESARNIAEQIPTLSIQERRRPLNYPGDSLNPA